MRVVNLCKITRWGFSEASVGTPPEAAPRRWRGWAISVYAAWPHTVGLGSKADPFRLSHQPADSVCCGVGSPLLKVWRVEVLPCETSQESRVASLPSGLQPAGTGPGSALGWHTAKIAQHY